VEQLQAVGREQAGRRLEVRPVVARPDVLEHADRHDAVEGAGHAAVVADVNRHGQARASLARQLRLPCRQRDARHARAVPFGGEAGERAPSATDVEHAVARPQAELPRDEVVLGVLRVVERRRPAPVRATVRHRRAQHGRVQLVAEVVVGGHAFARPADRLVVEQAGGHRLRGLPRTAAEEPLDTARQKPRRHLVERVAVPVAVHVRLASAQGAVQQGAGECAFPVNPGVPRLVAVDRDARGGAGGGNPVPGPP
jgi:hypothetical protein